MTQERLADTCGKWLTQMALDDERIWALDGDLADSDGAIHFAQRHPDRFVMAGIAEQAMVSVAAGMASCGLRPWVFSFASFLVFRAYDQVRIGLSQARQPVCLVGTHSGALTGRNGKSHAALNDLAALLSLPYLTIWSPSDADELRYAMGQMHEEAQPSYLRLPRRPLPPLGGAPAPWRWLVRGGEVTIVTTGLATHLAVEAADILAQQGIECGVLQCLRLKPWPAQQIRHALSDASVLLTLEDHVCTGGLGALVGSLELGVPVHALGWPLDWCGQSGDASSLLGAAQLSPHQIAAGIAGLTR